MMGRPGAGGLRARWTWATLAVVAATVAWTEAPKPERPVSEAETAIKDVYVYAYPLVTLEMARRVMTNVASPDEEHAPMGQFRHRRRYPTPQVRDVSAPNADTLSSTAWIDVSSEPYVLSIPDAHERYVLVAILDAWSNVFASLGTRTSGSRAQAYAITGPGWRGTLPPGVKQIKAPTASVWIVGQIACTGTPEDYAKVHAFQDRLALVPVSAYDKSSFVPPPAAIDRTVDMKTPVREQVNHLDAVSFFQMAAALMAKNPPSAADLSLLGDELAGLGIVPGRPFDPAKLPPDADKAIAWAQLDIVASAPKLGRHVNGWAIFTKLGTYGTNYPLRAMTAWFSPGASLPEDAVAPSSLAAADGKPYDGGGRYLIHFGKGEAPPVNASWSLTLYDADLAFVDNPLHKHAVSPRDALVYNEDGSLDLYVQHDSPGPLKEANWLPAPNGRFVLMLRLYWPKSPVLDGVWTPPAVRKRERQAPSHAERGEVAPL